MNNCGRLVKDSPISYETESQVSALLGVNRRKAFPLVCTETRFSIQPLTKQVHLERDVNMKPLCLNNSIQHSGGRSH